MRRRVIADSVGTINSVLSEHDKVVQPGRDGLPQQPAANLLADRRSCFAFQPRQPHHQPREAGAARPF